MNDLEYFIRFCVLLVIQNTLIYILCGFSWLQFVFFVLPDAGSNKLSILKSN